MSFDFIEDACDTLDKTEFSYVLLVGNGNKTAVFSNIGKDNIEILRRMAKDNFLKKVILDHLKKVEEN